jgi:hypothetical protein
MSERWFPVREPRLRSEQTYLIPATDLTNRHLKRSIVAKSTPKRVSPYPPVTKKKPAKMVTRSPPAKTIRPILIDSDSDIPGGLQLALIGPADPSGGAAGGLPPALPSPFPPVEPLQTVKTGAGALDPAGGAKRKTGNGNGRNGNGNGQKTQEEIEKERQERAERMRLREEKAEQERLARIKQKEADNKESQRLEKERQERDYRTQEELVKKQMEKERLAREQQVAEEAANALKTPKCSDSLKPPTKPLTPLVTVIETGKDQGKLVSVESVVTRPPSTNVVSGVYTSNYFRPINKPPVTPCPTTDDEYLRPQSAPVASSAAKPVPTKFSNEWFDRYELSSPITPFSRPRSRMNRTPASTPGFRTPANTTGASDFQTPGNNNNNTFNGDSPFAGQTNDDDIAYLAYLRRQELDKQARIEELAQKAQKEM